LKLADKWVLLLGGRYDQFHMINNVLHAPATSTDETDSAFTGRAGLVYKAANGLAPYISYTESFEPTSGVDRLGQRFKPSSGTQWEAGLRYQPEDSDTLISAALFNLTRTNVLTPDPLSPTDSVQSGEVRSRGLELELKTRIGRYIDVIGAYTYTNAVVTKSNNPAELGENFNSPKISSRCGPMPSWALSICRNGVPAPVSVTFRRVRTDSRSRLAAARPIHCSMPGSVSKAVPWLYALNALNLADKVYIPSMCYAGLCDYGTPRQVTATMTYRW